MRTFITAALTLIAFTSPAAFTFDAAVVSNNRVSAPSSTSILEPAWGRVIAKGDIKLLTLSLNTSTRRLSAGTRFIGAGVDGDIWVRFQTASMFTDQSLDPVFPSNINGVPVTDFYNQVMKGSYGGPYPGWTNNTVTLVGFDYLRVGSAVDFNGKPILFDTPTSGVYPLGRGALVQQTPSVSAEIDSINAKLDYTFWKNHAINGMIYGVSISGLSAFYLRPQNQTASIFLDSQNRPLYYNSAQNSLTVTAAGNVPLALSHLNRASHVWADGTTVNSVPGWDPVADAVLFIDKTPSGESVNVSLPNDFFFKGLVYVNGNLKVAGASNSPTVKGYNPWDWNTYMSGMPGGSTLQIPRCFMQGVLCVTGSYEASGAPAIYGTLVAGDVFDITGTPKVYYDSRNGSPGYMFNGQHVPVRMSGFTLE